MLQLQVLDGQTIDKRLMPSIRPLGVTRKQADEDIRRTAEFTRNEMVMAECGGIPAPYLELGLFARIRHWLFKQ